MTKYQLPATLLCDFYKVSHKNAYPEGTQVIYSTFTPRSNKYLPIADKVVMFGLQGFIKKYLIDYFNEHFFERDLEDVLIEYERIIRHTLGLKDVDVTHIEKLHNLGYLPIKISALDEGSLVPIKVPVLTIENTIDDFYWLTNYLETLISTELWQPITSATISHEYKKLLDKYALDTTGSTEGVVFQGHDFSMRGMSSLDTAMLSGSGHLLSFNGTDTIPAIMYLEKYYNANVEKELVGSSIPATEHSIMSALTPADGDRNEYEAFKRLITKVYPNGIMSIVSDTYDFWKVIGETLPKLKKEIMNRDGKVVIRPDSGDPISILCGLEIEDLTEYFNVFSLNEVKRVFHIMLIDKLLKYTPYGEYGKDEVEGKFKYKNKYYKLKVKVIYERYDEKYFYIDDSKIIEFKEFTPEISDLGLIENLWNTFGGYVNEKGYKVLDSHIGVIYGDSITLDRAETIMDKLKNKGFASTNVVFGIGSYTFQYNTRDTLGFAMKATYAKIKGEDVLLFKDPKTDDGTKRSQKGKVFVSENNGELFVSDGHLDLSKIKGVNLLKPVFVDGDLISETSFSEIRNKLKINTLK